MKKEFIEKIENLLLSERNNILSKLSQNTDIDFDGDETDEVQANLIASINNQLSSLDKEKLVKTNNALLKIKNGNFGQCEDCSEEISEKRLLVNPGFSTCISCAEHLELEIKKNKRV